MSEKDASFLSRWSKRKIDSKTEPTETTVAAVSTPDTHGQDKPYPEPEPYDPKTFDSKAFPLPIPDLEEIVAGFDMRPFLQKGVPESLKNAALRKLWHLDPAITEFVSPALDYAHDYNKLETISGFGPLTSNHDLSNLLNTLFSTRDKASDLAEADHDLPEPEKEDAYKTDQAPPHDQHTRTVPTLNHQEGSIQNLAAVPDIPEDKFEMAQNEHAKQDVCPILRDRKSQFARHGSALPE